MRNLVIEKVERPDPAIYFGPPGSGYLSWDTLIWRFAAEKSYWLATAAERPHTMPVWGIWQDSAFIFSTYPESTKAQNMRHTPYATVHLADTEALFSLECTTREVTEQDQLQAFIDDYNPKYRWDFTMDDVKRGVFALTPYKAFD